MSKENKDDVKAKIAAIDIDKEAAEASHVAPVTAPGIKDDEMYIEKENRADGSIRIRSCKKADFEYFRLRGFKASNG